MICDLRSPMVCQVPTDISENVTANNFTAVENQIGENKSRAELSVAHSTVIGDTLERGEIASDSYRCESLASILEREELGP